MQQRQRLKPRTKFYTMTDERIIEHYRIQLDAANEEKRMLLTQVKALTEEVSVLRSTIQDTSNNINKLLSEIKSLYETLNAKDSRIIDLENQLSALQKNKC